MSSTIQLPGLIDIHVHLRDPGETEKEDFSTGTKAAIAGGITTVFDMPNNKDPLLTAEKLEQKKKIAKEKTYCDWSLYFGSNGLNLDQFDRVANEVIGLKIYLSQTTGNLHVQDWDLIGQIFNAWPKDKVIMLHAEGETVDLALEYAAKYGNKIHLTHISTKKALQELLDAKNYGLPVTCDVTPHHLFLTKEDGKKLGPLGLMKPGLATESDQQFLWQHLDEVDCIASDHAPHTIEEKQSQNPPMGVPGLETMLPLLLTAVNEGRLTMADVIRLTNTNPQKIFGFRQDSQTYIEVDPDFEYTITRDHLYTKCGWSPFEGRKVKGKVIRVYIRGEKVFEDGEILVSAGFGKNIYPSTL